MAVMIERLAPEATGAQIADALTRDGCAVVEGMADSAAMDELMRETEMDFATRKLGIDEFSGYKTKRENPAHHYSSISPGLSHSCTNLGKTTSPRIYTHASSGIGLQASKVLWGTADEKS